MSTPNTSWLYVWGLGSVALGGASLLVPLYVVTLGGDPFDLGLLAALAAIAGVPAALFFGRLADQTGKRRVFVLGALVATAVMLAVLPLIQSIGGVIAANAVIWFSFAAAGLVLTLLVVGGAPTDEWQTRIARLNKFQGWGWAGGLVLGMIWTVLFAQWLDPMAVHQTFFAACALAAISGAAGLAYLLPPESEKPISERMQKRLRRAVLQARRMNIRGATFPFTPGRLYWTTRSFRPQQFAERFSAALASYFLAVLVFFSGFTAFFAPLPIFLADTGLGSGAIFALYLISSLGSAAFFASAGGLAGRYNLSVLQTSGLGLRGLLLPTVALIGTAIGATILGLVLSGVVFALIGVTWAVIAVTAVTLVTRLAPEAIRGEAIGVYTALTALAGFGGSLLGGWLADINYGLAFGVAGALVLVGALLVFALRGREGVEASAASDAA